MKRLRWRASVCVAVLLLATQSGCQVVLAADAAALQRVSQRVLAAAAPWCGRWAELDAQGMRRCVLPVRTVAAGDQGYAVSMLDSTLISEAAVRKLDEAQLAHVIGHEVSHFVLGHGRVRLQQQSPQLANHPLTDLMLAPAHAQTPASLPAQELDADALGSFLAALAGYPLRAGVQLWPAQLAAAMGVSPEASATHPSGAQRGASLTAQVQAWCKVLRDPRDAVPLPERLLPERLLPEADHRREDIVLMMQKLDADIACAGMAPTRAAT